MIVFILFFYIILQVPIILGKVKKKSSKECFYVDKMSQYGAVWQ